jgi:hypothetical protein
VVVVVQDKLWHGFIGQIGGQHNDLADRLVQGWEAARIGVRARQVRHICEPVAIGN